MSIPGFDFLGAAANKPYFGWLSFSWLFEKRGHALRRVLFFLGLERIEDRGGESLVRWEA